MFLEAAKRVFGGFFALIFLAAVPTLAYAEDTGPWSGKAKLGWLATSGNSDTTNLLAAFDLGYTIDRWTHHLGVVANGASSDKVSTAERYVLGAKTKYAFTEFNYVFGLVNYEKDKFSGYDQQLSEAIGLGRRVIHSDRHTLNIEAGLGFKQADLRDGTSESGAILRAGGDYTWKISDNAQFLSGLAIEAGSDNTFLSSANELKASLNSSMALVLGVTFKHNTDVPADSKKTDTFTSVSLEYAF